MKPRCAVTKLGVNRTNSEAATEWRSDLPLTCGVERMVGKLTIQIILRLAARATMIPNARILYAVT